MIDYTKGNIEKVSAHSVGNKNNGEELFLSKSSLELNDLKLREVLFKFFLYPFANPEFYSFTFSNEDFTLSPIYKYITDIFDNAKNFHRNSSNIAKHLYHLSSHPQIKSGDLFITLFNDIVLHDEIINVVGIFKCENTQTFLKLKNKGEDFSLKYDTGINPNELDKGCLIFNTDKDSGYKICIIDKSNKSLEAKYWRDDFLQLKPLNDEYHNTKYILGVTKEFTANHLPGIVEIQRADQIDLLNRSIEYFKTNETFNKKDFEQKIFQDEQIIKSFRKFDSDNRKENNVDILDTFEISPQAVKKQAKFFKSVLKLDKNFHVYIHGNRNLIQQGIEKDGRKYYKIYYDVES